MSLPGRIRMFRHRGGCGRVLETTARFAFVALLLCGCSSSVDTSYGRSRGASVNGTGGFADLVRARGHEVKAAVRLTDELRDWADVIVRFAPTPGPPARDEAKWYGEWLNRSRGRRVVYVPGDFDAEFEYWSRVFDQLPNEAPARLRERVEEARNSADGWERRLPPTPKETAAPEDWFAVKAPETLPVVKVCKTLGGDWARGADAERAALPRRETLKVDSETVLLRGDDEPLVIDWTRQNASKVLVAANGSFLLNGGLANPARRPLAVRVADWLGRDEDDPGRDGAPKRVAFVEGKFVTAVEANGPSVFALLRVWPFGWVTAQLAALGLAAALARAPRLGRAIPDPKTDADRPVAHPEALGALLARTGQSGEARQILETYRRWRNGPGAGTASRGTRNTLRAETALNSYDATQQPASTASTAVPSETPSLRA